MAGGSNRYAYVHNNPLNASDPSGLSPCFAQGLAWAVVGAGVGRLGALVGALTGPGDTVIAPASIAVGAIIGFVGGYGACDLRQANIVPTTPTDNTEPGGGPGQRRGPPIAPLPDPTGEPVPIYRVPSPDQYQDLYASGRMTGIRKGYCLCQRITLT